MNTFFRPLVVALAAALLCGLAPEAAASHFRFANLSWKRAPGTNSLAVEITVTEAWALNSGGIGSIFYYYDDGSGGFSTSTATRIATLSDSVGEQFEVWRYSTTHTYPSNGIFTVYGSSCCRISTLVNAADASESLTMLVDLRNPANTGSPVTTAPVILQMQAGANNSIALPIVDPDGDAFTVRLATSAESSIASIPTVGGNAISVTAGGVLNWNTAGGTSGQKFALQVVIEENRAGNTSGTNGRVPLDFIIELAGSLTNLPPTITGTNGSITLAANQTFTTTFIGTDPEGGPLRVNHQGLPPGATITPADGTTNASPSSVTFSWTPAPSDVGSSYAVLIYFTDQGGLQRPASFALTVSASAAVRDFELLSINSSATASGSGASLNPVVSSNGQYVAFVSDATNLVANDGNGKRDVFWRDRVAGTTRLVSRTAAGASGNGESDAPAISPDGRYVAFHSRASNLVATDNNTNYDVFLWDAHDDSVTLVSRTASGASGAGDSYSPQLSASGRVVSFASTAADLVGSDTNGTSDAFARDMDAGVTYLASINTNGFSGDGASGVPVLSANGRFVAFLSRAGDLVTNDLNALNDVFVHDLQTRVTKIVSVNVAGTQGGNRISFDPVISADGRYIAFSSQATNLVTIPDTNNFPDVFVRDMQLGVTKLVSVNGSGTASGGNTGISSILPASFTPFLSADGTKVLFVSLAQDLVANDSNGKQDVFLRDHINNTTTLISTNRFGTGSGNAASGIGAYSMSADLRYVAFFSEASNLGAADTNSRTDVFLRDLATNSTKIISRVSNGGFAANGHSFQPVISADGSTILFTTEAENLDNRDANAASDVFAAATTLGAPNFGVVDVGISISSVSARTVGTPFTLTITVTNNSAAPATGLVVGSTKPEFVSFLSGSVSQGTIGTNGWVVGDLAANGSATATITQVATNLGTGNQIVSIIRRDQLDSNLNNNSALSTITADRTAAGALFYLPGNTPYLSRTNSPFFAQILAGTVTVEDFESGAFSLAGVTASAGRVGGPGGQTDSVDADDGVVDGNGNGGHSFLVNTTNEVTFSFSAAVLGRLPTKVGIVLTDGYPTGSGIEAFDKNGVSLGVIGPFEIGDNLFTGETAEDRFLGVEFSGGISALRVFYQQADFEVDHLQFDIPTTDLQLTGTAPATALAGANFTVTLALTNAGLNSVTSAMVTNADPGPILLVSAVASQGAFDSQTGTWNVGALPVGTGALLTLTIMPTNSGQIQFFSRVLSELPDRNTTNDTVTRTVVVPNQQPVLTFASNNVVVLEDAGARSIASFASASAVEAGQSITNVTVRSLTASLFSVQPTLMPNGTLTFTPATNASGSAVVEVFAQDDGGTANGGVDKTTNTFTITVTSVNDAPMVTLVAALIGVLEDSGAYPTGAGFASFSPGPGDESSQVLLGYAVSNNNTALFSAQPAIAANGTLTFTPSPNSNGTATVTVIAQDNGGTANGGVDRTTNIFTISVMPVNDAPTFAFTTNSVVALEDSGAVTVSSFASVTSFGPDESGQTLLGYSVTNNNTSLFSVQPAIDASGTLTFTPVTNGNGMATVTVIAQDSGGTANGGVDTATNTFTITITPVNDAPVITFTTNTLFASEDSGANTFTAFATFNPAESGQTITNVTATNSNPAIFSVQPYFTVDGTLRFTPAPDSTGTGVVTVVVQDNGGTTDGGVDKATNTFTLIVSPVNIAPSFTLTNFPATDGVQDWVRDATATTSSGVKVVTDSQGNVVVAGDEQVGSGEVTTYQVRLVKYSNSGTTLWNTAITGDAGDSVQVKGLALDSAGAVIVVADYTGQTHDFLTIKYDADAALVWSNRFDALGDDVPMAVAVDGKDKVIVTGSSRTNGYTDYLTIKYLSDGTPFWTNRSSYAGPGNDVPKSVAVDAAGDVYVTGDGSNTDYTYAYTLKLAAATGLPVWTNQFDLGGQNSTAEAVRVDSGGNVIVAGTLNDAISQTQAYFGVVKYSSAGAVIWTNLYARNMEFQHVHGLAVDSAGNAIITGNTEVSGDMDFTTIKYLADGTPAWTNHYSGLLSGRDHPNAIAVNTAGEVFVTGESVGSNGSDFLTVKYAASGLGVWTNRYNGTANGEDFAYALATDSATNVFVTGAADGLMRTIKYAFTPSPGANQTLGNTGGVVNLPGFIASSSVGPANESTQSITFAVTNDNSGLFAVQPAISPGGVLAYTVNPGVSGLAVVTVRAQDTGGTDNGGVDTSVAQSFNITVLSGNSAAFYVWLGGTGDWNDPAAWTPRGVPGVEDSVSIASGTVQITNSVAVAHLTLDGGTLGGAGSLAVRSSMNWNGGVMSGAGTTTIAIGATLAISGAAEKNLNRRLDNYGAVTWTDARITGDSAPVINNYAGATFHIQTDTTLFESYSGGARTFNNAGTVIKSVATGVSAIQGTFNQTGTVDTRTGTINPTIAINLGVSTFTGAGRFLISGGTLTLNGAVTVASGANFEFAGGSLTGTGTILGTLNWTGGTMGGTGTTTIATGSVLALSGAVEKGLNRRLDNYGTITWAGARITGDNSPVLNNKPGALLDIQTDATLYESYSGGVRTLNNAGIVRKSAGTGVSILYGTFNNMSEVNVQTGSLGLADAVNLYETSLTGAGRFHVASGVLTLNGTVTVAGGTIFEFSGGSLVGAGTIVGTMKWTGGTMDGAGTTTIATNGVLNVSGAEKYLNRRLDNYGTVTWTGARIIGDNGPVINNYAGALFDTQTDATLFESNDVTVKTFNNAGTVRKSVATGTSTWQGLFNNGGTLNVQTGTLSLAGGGASTGAFTNAVGGIVAFTGGTQVLNSGASFSGAGTNRINGATVNISPGVTVAVTGNFELASGTLGGAGTFFVSGGSQMAWTGGVMAAGGRTTIATNGVLNISGNEKYLNRRLDNYGTVTWTGARIIGDNGPVINNYAGALFDTQTDATLFESNDVTVKTFNNSGTVRKSVATGTSTWSGVFNNSGLVEVQTGTLSLPGGGVLAGAFTSSLGALLDFTGGTQVLNSGISFSGAGLIRISSGSVLISANVAFAAPSRFEFAGGTLGGAGTFTIPAGSQMVWTGGTMEGTGTTTVATNGLLLISGGQKYLNRRLDNYGTVTWTGARIIGDNGPTINNYAGAIFDAQTDASLFDSNDASVKTFNNAGTVRKSVATGTSTWQGLFNNVGTLYVQTGTLSLLGGGASTGAFTNAVGGILDFTGATQVLNTGASFVGAGLSRISGATVTIGAGATVTVAGNFELTSGNLGGSGTFFIAAGSQMAWTGGVMGDTGTTTVATNGVLLVSGGEKYLNRRLDNYGTVTWTGARIIGDNGPVINNYAGALFDSQTGASLFDSNDALVKTFNNTGTVRKSAGTGTQIFSGTFNNMGLLELRTGTLTLVGNYVPGAASSLRIFLGGLTAGTQFGQLQINGTATLNGTLDIVLTNSFVPVSANSFAVVTAGTRSGFFSSVTGANLGGGLSLDPTYLSTGLTLVAVMVAGLPPLSPLAVGPERLLRWPGGFDGYELQTTTALGPNAEWTPVRAPVELEGGDSVVRLPVTGGIRFYRLVRPNPPRIGTNPTQ